MNQDIANLIDENTLGEAAHMFSGALERKMKERAESIKLLSASKCSCPTSSSRHQFYQED